MKRTDRLIKVVAAFCLLYVAIAAVDRTREVFPFFAWDLFAYVPKAQSTDYSVRLLGADGRVLNPPVYFDDAGSRLSKSGSIEAFQLMQQLGQALAQKSPSADRLRRLFESRYLADLHSADYQVVRRRFDITKRLSCRCFLQEVPLGRFTLHGQ